MALTTARDILNDAVTAFETSTSVDDAIDTIRTSTADPEYTIYYAYVVDEDGALSGVASLRELLNADGEMPVSSIATESVVSVTDSDPADHVAKVFARDKFMALPVVDDDSSELLGVVRPSDVIEALDEESSKAVLAETFRDIQYDPAAESTYECFNCGTLIEAADNPGACPNCGGDVRHRRTTIE